MPSLLSLKKALLVVTKNEYKDEDLIFHFGIPIEDVLKRLSIEEEQYDDIANKMDDYFKRDERSRNFFPGIESMLEEIYNKGIYMGIVTSQSRKEYEEGINKTKIGKYFKLVICADDTDKHRPYPDPLKAFIDKLNIKKEEVIYIGDTNYDSVSAKAANIDFGLVLWGTLDRNIKADYYFENPKDIINLFY